MCHAEKRTVACGLDTAGMPYLNKDAGQYTHTVGIYYAPVTLEAGRTVASVTLPAISQNANASVPAMHIFGMAIG